MHRRTAAVALLLIAACGDADAVRFYEEALAALRDGDPGAAEKAAERAAARGDADMVARCEFVRGNAAFARCELAERQAATPGAEPFALDVAINYGEKALRYWQVAAMSRADWPAARRNVGRALLKLAALRKKKDERDPQRRSDPQPRPVPLPQPKERPPAADEPDRDEPIRALSPEQVRRLLETLARKEQEKRALRVETRKARMAGVERDW